MVESSYSRLYGNTASSYMYYYKSHLKIWLYIKVHSAFSRYINYNKLQHMITWRLLQDATVIFPYRRVSLSWCNTSETPVITTRKYLSRIIQHPKHRELFEKKNGFSSCFFFSTKQLCNCLENHWYTHTLEYKLYKSIIKNSNEKMKVLIQFPSSVGDIFNYERIF